VSKALASPVPPKRKQPPPHKSLLEPVKGFMDAMLREDLNAPRKQKHTVSRIRERLAAEHDFECAGHTTVRDYVARRRPTIRRTWMRAPRPSVTPMPPPQTPAGAVRPWHTTRIWPTVSGRRCPAVPTPAR
jgi:hypothetical protein